MIHLYLGSGRDKAREALEKDITRYAKGAHLARLSDASLIGDVTRALSTTASMFGEARAAVFDGLCGVEETRALLLRALPSIAESAEHFFILEEKPDAQAKRALEKHAETKQTFDKQKTKESSSVFALADKLKAADKKDLWVAYQRELSEGKAPEAIHGVLFWGAKQMLSRPRPGQEARARALVAHLAELPHEARRRGFELEYALEHFILSLA